jgi:GxxExxY protein
MEGFVMLQEEQISYAIQGCVFEVYRQLGCGFLEKVYEKALLAELELQGLMAEAQVPVRVQYKNVMVGEYFADIVVEGRVILELKAQQNLPQASRAQLLNYLKATGLHLGMLINFAFPKASIKRIVL